MARQKGSKNATHTNRQERITTTIDPAIKREWKAFCARTNQTVAQRLEMLVRQDLQQVAGAIGAEEGKE
jgi:hypothetical protein